MLIDQRKNICYTYPYDVKKYQDKQEFINNSNKYFVIKKICYESYKYCFLVRNTKY